MVAAAVAPVDVRIPSDGLTPLAAVTFQLVSRCMVNALADAASCACRFVLKRARGTLCQEQPCCVAWPSSQSIPSRTT